MAAEPPVSSGVVTEPARNTKVDVCCDNVHVEKTNRDRNTVSPPSLHLRRCHLYFLLSAFTLDEADVRSSGSETRGEKNGIHSLCAICVRVCGDVHQMGCANADLRSSLESKVLDGIKQGLHGSLKRPRGHQP